MRKKIVIPAVIFVAIAAAMVAVLRHRSFYYAGTIEATEVDCSARIAGMISAVTVDEGGAVSAGQELVRLSLEDIAIAAAQAEKEFSRARELLTAGSMNRDAYDKIKFRRDDLAVRLSWGTITSPINGVVLSRYHEPGELVAPGTKLLTLADMSSVWAHIYVDQPVLARLSLGMKLTAIVPDSSLPPREGTIVHIRDEAEFTPKNVQTRSERTRLVYGVKVSFDNTDRAYKPGMTVEMQLPEQ